MWHEDREESVTATGDELGAVRREIEDDLAVAGAVLAGDGFHTAMLPRTSGSGRREGTYDPRVRARTLMLLPLLVLIGVASPAPATPRERPPANVQAWLPYWVFDEAVRDANRNADLLDTVSPFWFNAAGCHRIDNKPTARNAGAVARLHGRGLLVTPSVTAGGLPPRTAVRCLGNSSSRTAHVRRLVRLAVSGDYDGLDIDYENLALTTNVGQARRVRRAFTAFVEQLCPALRRNGRTCSITVMPRTGPGFTVWRGKLIPAVYDYKRIGRVADEVRVMAYDQHAHQFGPGPIAGWPWVKQVVAFASSQMEAQRFRLGIPTYGRDFARGGSVSLTGNQARQRARQHGAKIRWSREQREAWFTYRVGGVRHEVWFSSPRAVAVRARYADRLGLRGSALWAAGLGASGTWSALRRR